MAKIEINVTSKDIEQNTDQVFKRERSETCPVALAAKRAFGCPVRVSLDVPSIDPASWSRSKKFEHVIVVKRAGSVELFPIPAAVVKKIRNFDALRTVKPFKFSVGK